MNPILNNKLYYFLIFRALWIRRFNQPHPAVLKNEPNKSAGCLVWTNRSRRCNLVLLYSFNASNNWLDLIFFSFKNHPLIESSLYKKMIIFARKISWNQFHEKFREIEYATLNWPVQLDSFMPQWSKENLPRKIIVLSQVQIWINYTNFFLATDSNFLNNASWYNESR